ncbi:MAG: DUF3352 domain-containing protein [Bacteroidia bacterium]
MLSGIIATVVVIIALAVVFYLNFIRVKSVPALHAVPSSACLIFEVKNIQNAWKNFAATDMWKDLEKNEAVKKVNQKINLIDSLIGLNEELKKMLSSNKAVVSFHAQEGQKLSLLLVAETGKKLEADEFIKWISAAYHFNVLKRTFEAATVFDLVTEDKKTAISVCYHEQLLIISEESSLVEESIRKLKYNLGNSTKGLEQLAAMAETTGDASVYVNYRLLPSYFNLFTKPEYSDQFSFIRQMANWTVFNIRLGNESMHFTGLTVTDDSLFQFLDLFKTQSPVEMNMQKLLPKNTAFYLQIGCSDYPKYATDLAEYLQVHKKADLYNRYTDSLEKRYGIDLGDKFSSLVGNEAILGMMEPVSSDYKKELFAVIQFKDQALAAAQLNNFVLAITKRGEMDSAGTSTYNGLTIQHLLLGNFLKLYYGELFENIRSPYFTQVDNAFVFANNMQSLKNIIDNYKTGNTLVNDGRFGRFMENSANSSNVNFFLSPGYCFLLPSSYITDDFLSILNRYHFDFKKYEYLSVQFANSNNKAFFTSINFKFNPSFKEDTRVLWTLKLDTGFSVAPAIVYNSTAKQNAILVQDINNTLYYINNTGNISWRTKLSGKIISSITQMDPQKNGKIYYLFNTTSQACMIDENGNNMIGYPIRFPGTATASLSIFDFGNDSNYQLFVPLENNRVAGYTINGKPIQGWNPKVCDEKIVSKIGCIRAGKRSFIFASGSKGTIMIWSAKGEKLKGDYQAKVNANLSPFTVVADSVSSFVALCDSSGLLSIFTVDTTLKFIPNNMFSFTSKPDYIEMNFNPDSKQWTILSGTQKEFSVYDKPGHILFSQQLQDSGFVKPFFNFTTNGNLMISYSSLSSGKLHWFTNSGAEYPSFPVDGSTIFTVGNLMSDGSNYLVCGDRDNHLILVKLK